MNRNTCLVSVIVPVCNVQTYLRQCLDSLTDQTLQDIQIICIDDGSTDGSLSILKEYSRRDSRIEIISKPNAGYGHTMNVGLSAAKGEYIGIVESDDFAETKMFEELYKLARKSDADVAKSNFFQYITNTIPDNDPIVNNLEACKKDTVFCPLNDQNIFLTQPAIWSALYKRSFLQEEGISFLETPGASFQDTSFNFKVFAAAKRVVVTNEAYLHYRIDNANSSVKSLKKIFCICDEYREIWEFASSRQDVYSHLKYRIPQIQFGGYLWNLERLTPALQYQFFDKFVKEFQSFKDKDLLRKEYFDDIAWEKLTGILSDPDGYFEKNYGSITVDKTFLLTTVSKNISGNIERPIRAILELLGENDELYVSFGAGVINKPSLKTLLANEVRIHPLEEEITEAAISRLNPDLIQGKEVVPILLGGPEWSSSKTPKLLNDIKNVLATNEVVVNGSWVLGKYNTESLKGHNFPIWLPLLYSNFYSLATEDFISVPDWVIRVEELISVSLKDYKAIVEEYKEIYNCCLSLYTKNPSLKPKMKNLISLLWKCVNDAYDIMSYDDRKKFGNRPSPLDLEPWAVCGSLSARETTKISVIVPVYNSEAFLPQCLESVLNQNFDDLEVICVDDGSTDGSFDLLCSYVTKDSRIKVISQFNGGAGSARNRGIVASSGDYLAFIDPDDSYPSNNVLSKLYYAAVRNNVKLSAGSFVMKYPDGSEKNYFGGEQHFYTIRTEGKQSLKALQTDYGWIRFMYHKSIFEEGKVKFPEYRWYEDPVFFTEVMNYCDEFYGVVDPVYSYKADYKEPSWTVVKVRNMLAGIAHNLDFAKKTSSSTLYTMLVHRLNREYYSAIMEFINDEEVFSTLAKIQGNLDPSLIHDVRDNGWSTYLIKPFFDLISYRKNAVVRLAEKVGESSLYKRLQSVRERY